MTLHYSPTTNDALYRASPIARLPRVLFSVLRSLFSGVAQVKSKSNCNKGMGKCAGGAIRCPKNGVWEGLFEVERVAYGRKRIQKGWFGVLARV